MPLCVVDVDVCCSIRVPAASAAFTIAGKLGQERIAVSVDHPSSVMADVFGEKLPTFSQGMECLGLILAHEAAVSDEVSAHYSGKFTSVVLVSHDRPPILNANCSSDGFVA